MKTTTIIKTAWLCGLLLGLAGCNDGGGDSGPAATAATVDQTSAVALTSAVFSVSEGIVENSAPVLAVPLPFAKAGGAVPDTAGAFPAQLFALARRAVADSGAPAGFSAALKTETPPTSTGCGGSMTVTPSTTTTDFSGRIDFFDYDDCTFTINGGLSYTGSKNGNIFILTLSGIDVTVTDGTMTVTITGGAGLSVTTDASGTVTTAITVTYNNLILAVNDGTTTETFAFNGAFAFSCDSTGSNCTETISTEFTDADGKVYTTRDLVIGTDTAGNVTSLSGRITVPDRGYIDITTTTSFTYDVSSCSAGHPVTGELVITGAGGVTATLDADSGDCASYTLTIDDGATVTPGIENW